MGAPKQKEAPKKRQKLETIGGHCEKSRTFMFLHIIVAQSHFKQRFPLGMQNMLHTCVCDT